MAFSRYRGEAGCAEDVMFIGRNAEDLQIGESIKRSIR